MTDFVEAVVEAVALDVPPTAHNGLTIPYWPLLLHFSIEILPVIFWIHFEGVELVIVCDSFIFSPFPIPLGFLHWWVI